MDIEFKDLSTLNAPVHIVDYKLCSMDFMDYKLQIKIFILLGWAVHFMDYKISILLGWTVHSMV